MEESNGTAGAASEDIDPQAELCLRVLANGRRYFGSWRNYEDMKGDFYNNGEFPQDHSIVFASYGTGSYEGNCLVIYQADGKIYEVNASHCSCNGLGDSWKPEETSWEAIAMRRGYGGGILNEDHDPEAEAMLNLLIQAHTNG